MPSGANVDVPAPILVQGMELLSEYVDTPLDVVRRRDRQTIVPVVLGSPNQARVGLLAVGRHVGSESRLAHQHDANIRLDFLDEPFQAARFVAKERDQARTGTCLLRPTVWQIHRLADAVAQFLPECRGVEQRLCVTDASGLHAEPVPQEPQQQQQVQFGKARCIEDYGSNGTYQPLPGDVCVECADPR